MGTELWKEWPREQAEATGGRGGSCELIISEVGVSTDDGKWMWPADWSV